MSRYVAVFFLFSKGLVPERAHRQDVRVAEEGLEGLCAVAGTHCKDRAQWREETASRKKLF